MKIKNKLLIFFLFLTLIIPINTFAYSSKVILGGENIGIEVNGEGVLVVGFYKVDEKNIASSSGIKLGDMIIKVNGNNIDNLTDMAKLIDQNIHDSKVNLTIMRNKKEIDVTLNLVKTKDGIYKTGLYVKDKITGIGTLTYIDPTTKIFGALGHEIVESSTNKRFEIKNGTIFNSEVTTIIKSTDSKTGEKNARFYKDDILGNIKENTTNGIYGTYNSNYDKENLIEVATNDEIKLGPAKIVTVLSENTKEEYEINIIGINKNSKIKNILFEITDTKLIDKTNGVIKGMSGSPIIQNNKLIGAVTHAIVNDNNKGYGIFITTMLKEGEN